MCVCLYLCLVSECLYRVGKCMSVFVYEHVYKHADILVCVDVHALLQCAEVSLSMYTRT